MSDEKRETPRIYDYINKTTFLHIQDALGIKKVQLFAGKYRGGQGAELTLSHYVDLRVIRPLLHDLSWGKPIKFIDFKGTAKEDGPAESRVLSVNTKDDVVYWQLRNGPGQVIGQGAVKPDRSAPKTAFQQVTVRMTRQEARQTAYSTLEYLAAWRTAQLLGSVPTADRSKPAVLSLDELNDELFDAADDFDEIGTPVEELPEIPKLVVAAAPTNGASNGKLFANGDPCPTELLSEYDTFYEVMRTAPFDQEKLTAWKYRN